MNHQHTLWFDNKDEDTEVMIHESVAKGHVCLVFGRGISHTNWFMTENDLDTLVDNLVKAREEYFKESTHDSPTGNDRLSAESPLEGLG